MRMDRHFNSVVLLDKSGSYHLKGIEVLTLLLRVSADNVRCYKGKTFTP